MARGAASVPAPLLETRKKTIRIAAAKISSHHINFRSVRMDCSDHAINDVLDLVVGQLRIHRQGNRAGADSFGIRKLIAFVAEMIAIESEKVNRSEIDGNTNAGLLEARHDFVAPGRLD